MSPTFTPLRLLSAVSFALIVPACASTPAPVAEVGPAWDATSLPGSMWSEICPGGNPEQTWIALYDDNSFAYLYPDAQWQYDGTEQWSVEGDTLVVSWNEGFATSRYALSASTRLEGTTTKSCGKIALVYTGPAPELDWTEKTPEGTVAPE